MSDKTENPAEIYLVTDSEGDLVWCDTPAPGEGMREEDATRYVREDIYLALKAQVEVLQPNLKRAITAFRQYELDVDDYPSMKHKDMMMALNQAVNATPAQCLAEIKAQAVSEVWEHFDKKFCQHEKLTVQWICETINNHISYLRQAAKSGN